MKWLISACRKWLKNKIDELGVTTDYLSELFVFEECLFIYHKWDDDTLMKKFIARRWRKDNSTFINRYIDVQGYDNLQTHQIEFLLRLAGRNSKVFLEIMIKQIGNRRFLDANTRYLLKNVNWKLCADQNVKLCQEMLLKLSEMPEVSCEDLKLVLKLSVEAVRKVESLDYVDEGSTDLYGEEWSYLFRNCATFEDLMATVEVQNSQGRIKFMQAVIDLSAKFLYENPPSDEEAVGYVKSLEEMCINLSLHKVSMSYIDSIISIIQSTNYETKDLAINMLQLIKENPNICSDHENVHLIGEEFVISNSADTDSDLIEQLIKEQPSEDNSFEDQIPEGQYLATKQSSKLGAKIKSIFFTAKKAEHNTQRNKSMLQNYEGSIETSQLEPHDQVYDSLEATIRQNNLDVRYFKFEFTQPSDSSCGQSETQCGFIVKFTRDGVDIKCELCRESDIYRGTGIHIHDNIFVEDMYLHWVIPGSVWVKIGEKEWGRQLLSVPFKWGWWYWCKAVDAMKIEEFCVEYNDSVPSLPQLNHRNIDRQIK